MKSLNTQWNGDPSELSLGYELSISGDALEFTAEFPVGVQGHPEAREGEFTPELWRWDVAEIFLTGETGRYLEMNLSPAGAWWAEGFAAVREADAQFCHEDFHYTAQGSPPRVSATIVEIEKYLGAQASWRGNVTAILDSPSYLFLSKVALPGVEADFHQPKSFIPFADLITSS